MNELRRMAYLQALGIDGYVSRRQLPGAAVTRRLAVVRRDAASAAPLPVGDALQRPGPDIRRQRGAGNERGRDAESAGSLVSAKPQGAPPVSAVPLPRFSLTAIVAGSWLWLEALEGMPLTTEQMRLVQAMARALAGAGGIRGGAGEPALGAAGGQPASRDKDRPVIEQFDWPVHNNRQHDLGAAAARDCVAAFVARRLEEHACRGLVLLGEACRQWVPATGLGVPVVMTLGTAELLANPVLKGQVWRDLLPLASPAAIPA